MRSNWVWASVLTILVGCQTAGFAQSEKRRGTNRAYSQGDWVTYSVTRFVRDISIGYEYVYHATTGGITRFQHYQNSWDYPWTTSNGLADNNIFLVAFDFNTNKLWCVSQYAISHLEPASQTWSNIYFDEIGLRRNERIRSLGFGNDRRIYLATSSGGWYASDAVNTYFSSIQPPSDVSIVWHGQRDAKKGSLPNLFMSENRRFDSDRLVIQDYKLREFEVTCWEQDEWQNIWIGTWGLGAGRGDLTTFTLTMMPYGLWDSAVDALEREQDALWIGGVQNDNQDYPGVTFWDVADSPRYYEPYFMTGFDSGNITTIHQDNNFLWFGTPSGLVRFDLVKNSSETFTVVDNLVDNYVEDVVASQEYIWVATRGGVSRIEKSDAYKDSLRIKNVLYPQLGNIRVFDLEYQFNLLWMATEYGVFVYDTETETGGFYTGVEGPANQRTFAITCFENEVWFGSEEGISAFNIKTKEWLDPPARLYETDARIHRMVASKEAVWAATSQGVFKYDRFGQRWTTFTVQDGLPTDSVRSLLLDGDYIWFGSERGITHFYWNSPYRVD